MLKSDLNLVQLLHYFFIFKHKDSYTFAQCVERMSYFDVKIVQLHSRLQSVVIPVDVEEGSNMPGQFSPRSYRMNLGTIGSSGR